MSLLDLSLLTLARMCALFGGIVVIASNWQGDARSVEAWGIWAVIHALVSIGCSIEARRG